MRVRISSCPVQTSMTPRCAEWQQKPGTVWGWSAFTSLLWLCPGLFSTQHPLGSLQPWGAGECPLEIVLWKWLSNPEVAASRKLAGLCQHIALGSDTYLFFFFRGLPLYAQIVQACSKGNKFPYPLSCTQRCCPWFWEMLNLSPRVCLSLRARLEPACFYNVLLEW